MPLRLIAESALASSRSGDCPVSSWLRLWLSWFHRDEFDERRWVYALSSIWTGRDSVLCGFEAELKRLIET
jgi:hypothetical protein